MAGSNIKAGGAFVEMFVKDGTVAKTLDKVRRQLSAFGKSVSSIGLSSIGLGTAIGAPLAASVASFAASGAAVDDMANRTGIGSDALQELSYAAGQSATDMDSLEKGLLKMQRTMVEAGEGSQTARDALAKLGLSAADLSGLTGDMQFERIAEQIASIKDPAQRTAAAIAIFGKSGAQLLPLMNEGSAGIARMRDEARRLGLVMDQDAIKNAAVLDDGIHRLTMTMGAFKNAIGAAIVGPAIQFTGWLTTSVGAANRWIMANRGLVLGVGMVAVALVTAGAALLGIGTTIKVVSFAVGGLATAWAALGTVLTTIAASPFLVVVAGLAAITAAVPVMRDGVMSAIGDLTTGFGELLGIATTTLDGIVDAMSSGNMALAAKVLWAGVNAAWLAGTEGLRQVWREAVTGLSLMMTDAFAGIRSAWAITTQFIGGAWDAVVGGMGGTWSDWQNSLASGIAKLMARATGVDPAEMQKSLEEEQAGIKAASQARRTAREKETADRLKQIRKEAEEAKDVLGDGLNEQNKAAQAELQSAIDELNAARSEAASAKTESEKKRVTRATGATALGGDFTSTLGTFSASAAQQSRVSGLSGLQSAADRTAEATEELAERAKNGGLVFA